MKLKASKMIYTILFIIFLQLTKVNTTRCDEHCIDCDTSSGNEKCKACLENFYLGASTTLCYSKCSGSTPDDYYSINYLSNPCANFIHDCSGSIIVGTKECFGTSASPKCPDNFYLFNGICYPDQCPPLTKKVYDNSKTMYICNCTYNYKYASGKLTCFEEGKGCDDENKYLHVSTGECSGTECSETEKQRSKTKDGIKYVECVSSCDPDEKEEGGECVKNCKEGNYLYKEKGICSNNCLIEGAYKYKNNKDKTCVEKEKCLKKRIVDDSNHIYECYDSDSCPDSTYIFLYGTNICISDCSKTSNFIHEDTTSTFEYIQKSGDPEKIIKKCITETECKDNHMLIMINGNRCISKEECKNLGRFIYGDLCYEQCSLTEDKPFYNDDTRECVSSCSGDYFEYVNDAGNKKVCYKDCKNSGDKIYYKEETKKCIACKDQSEGFYLFDDPNPLKRCYAACPDNEKNYYFKGSNICYYSEKGCSEPISDGSHMYYLHGKKNECLKKCSDIDGWVSDKHIKTDQFECYLEENCPSSTDYKYYKYDLTCYKDRCPYENLIEVNHGSYIECKPIGDCTDFLEEGKCVGSCTYAEGYKYYISPVPADNQPGFCFKNIDSCYKLSYMYTIYKSNNETYECTKCDDTDHYKLEIDPKTSHPKERAEGNKDTCFPKSNGCPTNFPFLYENICHSGSSCPPQLKFHDENEETTINCKDSCDTKFNFRDYLCVENCSLTNDTFSYITGGVKKCLKSCQPDYYQNGTECVSDCGGYTMYFNPSTKVCSDSCLVFPDYKFKPVSSGDDPPLSPQKCLSSCEDAFYKAGTFDCISNCSSVLGFISLEDNKKCVLSCTYYSSDDTRCLSSCPKYYVRKGGKDICVDTIAEAKTILGIPGDQQLYAVNRTRQVVGECTSTDKYIDKNNNICYESRPTNAPYCQKNNNFFICEEKCSTDSSGKQTYHTINSFECELCPLTNFILELNLTCLSKCPKEYPVYDSDINGNYCKKECGTSTNKLLPNGKCVANCKKDDPSTKPFYDSSNNTCLDHCPEGKIFYTSQGGTYYECVSSCPKYVSPDNECIDDAFTSCNSTFNYIGRGNKCKKECDPNIDGKYYQEITGHTGYFQCLDICEKLTVESNKAVKECREDCPTNLYESPLGFCLEKCIDQQDSPYSFSSIESGKKVCSTKCSDNKVYNIDKICTDSCGSLVKLENGQCAERCDQSTPKKFNDTGICSEECTNAGKRYTEDFTCLPKCPTISRYVQNNKCSSSCVTTDNKYPFWRKLTTATDGEIECLPKCGDNEYYYDDVKECSISCGNLDFILENTHICNTTCSVDKGYYEYSSNGKKICVKSCKTTDLPFTDLYNKCTSTECDKESQYYFEEDKICKKGHECPSGYFKEQDTAKCITNCNANDFIDEYGRCVSSCIKSPIGNNYFVRPQKICIKKGEKECSGSKEFYIPYDQDNKIVSVISSAKTYECVESCPKNGLEFVTDETNKICIIKCKDAGKPYYIKNENYQPRYCLPSCTSEYPYLSGNCDLSTLSANDNLDDNWENCGCVQKCDFYVEGINNLNSGKKTCVPKCQDDYRFIGPNNRCYSECPNNMCHLFNETSSSEKVQCYEKCPSPLYLYVDQNVCVDENYCLNTKNYKVDLYSKTCVAQCNDNITPFRGGNSDNSPITKENFCVKDCFSQEKYGFLDKDDKLCVKNCPDVIQNSKGDEVSKHCICERLYCNMTTRAEGNIVHYYCFPNDKKKCEETGLAEDGKEYKYKVENEPFRCVDACEASYYLFEQDNICIKNCDSESMDIDVDHKTCRCKFNYYVNDLGKTICLKSGEECPSSKKLIKVESSAPGSLPAPNTLYRGECVEDCKTETLYQFLDFCFQDCESTNFSRNQTEFKCEAKYSWYKEDKKFYFSSPQTEDKCNDNNYPYLIEDTKECVKKCDNNENYILYNKKCINKCPDYTYVIESQVEKDGVVVANYTCRCNNIWKKNGDTIYCENDSEKKCTGIDLNYLEVYETKECVSTCASDLYLFNKKCYKNCKEASLDAKVELKEDINNNKNCICIGLWRKVDGLIECESKEYCKKETELLVKETQECITASQCPENTFKFNNICYKSEQCPRSTATGDNNNRKCECPNLFYKIINTNTELLEEEIYCLDSNITECPIELFNYTNGKECLNNSCPDGFKEFNYKCYSSCPEVEKSKDLEDSDKICGCDQNFYWFKTYDKEKNRIYYNCGKSECPSEKKFIVEATKECVESCEKIEKKHYLGTCYANCPPSTKEKKDNIFECEYRTLHDAKTKEALIDQVREDILRLYQSNPEGGIIFQNFSTSLHIYPISKNNSTNEKFALSSNLSLVNLDNCIGDIYSKNNLPNDAKIILTVYDLDTNKKEDSIINPSEYELFSSVDGHKLDASSCNGNSVQISYPLTYNIDKKATYEDAKYVNKLKKIFEISKKLNSNNKDVDLLNYNSSVFHSICTPCEIDGKDVLMKYRRTEFYPNVSICEDNCVLDHTDYEKERAYCFCPVKTSLNMGRVQEKSASVFYETETKKIQNGPSNLEAIKCIKNMVKDTKTAVTNNPGFYVSLGVMAGELAMGALCLFYSYNAFIAKITKRVTSSQIKTEGKKKAKKSNQNKENNENKENNDNNDNKENNDNNENNDVKSQNNDKPAQTNENQNLNEEKDNIINNDAQNLEQNNIKNSDIELNNIEDVSNPPKKGGVIESENAQIANENENDYNIDNDDLDNDINYKKHQAPEKLTIKNYDESNEKLAFSKNSKNRKRAIANTEKKEKTYQNEELYNLDEGLFSAIKKENKILRAPFKFSVKKNNTNIVVMVLTEIFDKIYFTKTFFLYRKLDIIPALVTLYLFYHLLLIAVCAIFYDIKTIEKIYTDKDYPDNKYYLLHAVFSFLIVAIIYGLLNVLIRFGNKVNDVISGRNKEKDNNDIKNSNDNREEEDSNTKINNLKSSIKIRLIIFFVITLALTIFCFIYIISFCAIYTGTRKYLFISYGISLVFIAAVKVVYGFILGILRFISIRGKFKCLYNIIRFFDTYIA